MEKQIWKTRLSAKLNLSPPPKMKPTLNHSEKKTQIPILKIYTIRREYWLKKNHPVYYNIM